jgi:DNA-binding CsgD family transcriptional regulator
LPAIRRGADDILRRNKRPSPPAAVVASEKTEKTQRSGEICRRIVRHKTFQTIALAY